MHRTSESIGTIAAALAKAQLELTNPAKSLVGTIPGMTPRGDRSFRYAPLSTGLDLVRKSLGRHEIATVQTTAIDNEAGLVRLTTILAHSSGEWLASDYPVCRVSETAAPQRMGMALTYARRYSLFALVGIAGEDDLDAPDLPIRATDLSQRLEVTAADSNRMNGSEVLRAASSGPGRRPVREPKPILAPDESAATCARLESEVAALNSLEDLIAWAARVLPTKNTLQPGDARAIEQAFEARVASFEKERPEDRGDPDEANPSSEAVGDDGAARLMIPKTRRKRDKAHLQYVASKPCLVCGRSPADAHHLRFSEPRALGRKVSDEFTVPLCRAHHRQAHNRGDEKAWWQEVMIDPKPAAARLWRETRE
jgi:hypothetical protein